MSGSGEELFGNSTTECRNPFDEDIFAIVAAVAATSGLISLLASCFIIFIIILFKKWRFYSQRLILYLAIAAALLAFSMVLQRVDYQNQTATSYYNFCVFAGFFSQFSGWMALNAILCITASLLITAFFNKQPKKLEPLFIFLIFIFPFMLNWIPFIKLAYGKAGAWCWIRSTEGTCTSFQFGQALQLVLWYVPLYVILFTLIVLYAVVLVKLHTTRKKWAGNFDPLAEKAKEQMRHDIYPLLAYPLIFFLLNMAPFINRIHGLVYPSNPEPALWFISAIFFPLQGGVIAVAFSLDPETRRRLTLANFRAAFREYFKTDKIKEYPIPTQQQFESNVPEKKI